MDKFLKRSHPSTSGTSGGGESKPKKNRHYDDNYLKYGFTVINNKPQCVICGDVLSRESMKPSKLTRHLTTKHQKEADKPLDFFERKLEAIRQQQNILIQVIKQPYNLIKISFGVLPLAYFLMVNHLLIYIVLFVFRYPVSTSQHY